MTSFLLWWKENVMKKQRGDLSLWDECYQIIGICMKVHSKLGSGFQEAVYQEALEIELRSACIKYEREKWLRIVYDGEPLAKKFKADFFVFDAIILEIKATTSMPSAAFRQTLNYMKAGEIKIGLLINFGESRLKFQRIICTPHP